MVNLLAFLVCRKATIDQNGRVTLHELADGLIIPSSESSLHRLPGPYRRREQVFFAFYKIIADTPGTVTLRVLTPSDEALPETWSDPISPLIGQQSTWQSLWALGTDLFHESGRYTLELWYSNVSVPVASTHLLVQIGE
ncbi:MAG TPA: hypothetical protein VG206_08095 [Terriglobia bacterium]|nr:hypothetical protein [Terriglobia bacterium]